MAGHIKPTVAQMIAVSNRTGWVVLMSKTLHASLKDKGLPNVISRVIARKNSKSTTAQMGNTVLERVLSFYETSDKNRSSDGSVCCRC